MRGLLLLSILAAVPILPAPARALPVDTVFQVTLLDGFDPADGTPAGGVTFKLDSDQGDRCRYRSSWDGAWEGSITSGCVLDERKTQGHRSCTKNAAVTFNTFFSNDPKGTCILPDGFGIRRDVHLIVGGEAGGLEMLVGIIQWTAAAPVLSAFEAQRYP